MTAKRYAMLAALSIGCCHSAHAQNPNMPSELVDNPAVQDMFHGYSMFLTAEECAQNGWQFTESDLSIIQKDIEEAGAKYSKEDKDEVWTFIINYMESHGGGRGKTGATEQICSNLKAALTYSMGDVFSRPSIGEPEEAPF